MSWSFVAAPIAAITFVIAWMLARRKKEDTNAQGMRTRVTDDGFWIRAPNLPAGSRVQYTCVVNSREVSDVVELDGETFVPTNGTPSLIRITEAVAVPSDAGHRSSARMPVAAPASISQISPWPSDRGSVRSVGVISAAPSPPPPPPPTPPPSPPAPPPVVPSAPAVAPPPAPSSARNFGVSIPPLPSRPPPLHSSRPLLAAPPVAPPSSSVGPPTPPTGISSLSKPPLRPALILAEPSSRPGDSEPSGPRSSERLPAAPLPEIEPEPDDEEPDDEKNDDES